MDKVARTRIRAVRFKSGGELRLMRPFHLDVEKRMRRDTDKVIKSMGPDLGGYAVMVWARGDISDSSIISFNTNPFVNYNMLPDYIGEKFRHRTAVAQAVYESTGYDSSEDPDPAA